MGRPDPFELAVWRAVGLVLDALARRRRRAELRRKAAAAQAEHRPNPDRWPGEGTEAEEWAALRDRYAAAHRSLGECLDNIRAAAVILEGLRRRGQVSDPAVEVRKQGRLLEALKRR